MPHSQATGVPTTRRFKFTYVAITALFVLTALGFAAAGLWVVALAAFGMGGMMGAASTQMAVMPRSQADTDRARRR